MLYFLATSGFAFAIENSIQNGPLLKSQKGKEEANQAKETVNKVFLDIAEFGPVELLKHTKQFADAV